MVIRLFGYSPCQYIRVSFVWATKQYVLRLALDLALNLCEPHICPCSADVADCTVFLQKHHRYVNKKRTAQWHHLASTQSSWHSCYQKACRSCSDRKRPDGLTLVSWQGGRCLTWDNTIVGTMAVSYVQIGSTASARSAAARKHVKYDTISGRHIFVPVAVETLGPFCDEGLNFFRNRSSSFYNLRRFARI